jgi:hypothetical protein
VRKTDQSCQGRIKSLLYRHDKPNEPTKEGAFSFVLKFTFASVSTVSRDNPWSQMNTIVKLVKCGKKIISTPAYKCTFWVKSFCSGIVLVYNFTTCTYGECGV